MQKLRYYVKVAKVKLKEQYQIFLADILLMTMDFKGMCAAMPINPKKTLDVEF